MDKLKPILTHKFWILVAIALILPLVGWYLGTGAQAAAIDARISTLNALKPADGATTPNERWIEKATAVKEERAEKVETAAEFLWEEQKDDMVWPTAMQQYVEGKVFGEEFDNVAALETYREIFDREVERLRQIVDPFEWDQRAMKWEGAVLLDRATLPLPDASLWQTGPPSSKEVWYLQEDIWLLEALLSSVRDVNDRAGADSNIIKAPIKQIALLELRGGDRTALGAAGAAGADGMGSMDPMGGMMPGGAHAGGAGFGMPGGMGEMYGGAMGMGGATAGGLDFSMDEEVGPVTAAATASADEASLDGSMEAGGEHGGDAGFSMPGAVPGGFGSGYPGMGGMGGMGGNPLLDAKRYVDEGPELPYKTRAFKMTVTMDHRQLPEFLVELTNSPFPVNIERVHWQELNPSQLYPPNTGGGDGYSPPGMLGSSGSGHGGGMAAPMPGPGMSSAHGSGGSPFSGSPFSGSGLTTPRPGLTPMGPGMGMSSMGRGPGSAHGSGGMMSGFGPPGMGTGMGYGMDEFGGSMAGQGNNPASQAMLDPYLCTVVIGGVMTIYKSPEEVQAATDAALTGEQPVDGTALPSEQPEAAATAADSAAPVEGTPPTEGPIPIDGTAPAGEAAPADGTTAPEAVTEPQPAAEDAADAEPTPVDPSATEVAPPTEPEAAAPAVVPAEESSAAPPR